jgi:hypothetical protein
MQPYKGVVLACDGLPDRKFPSLISPTASSNEGDSNHQGIRRTSRPACADLGLEDRMSKYRGYFIKDNHIVAPTVIEATEDAQAMLMAGELLLARRYPYIEVWQETRIVGSLSAPSPSHE